MIGDVLEDVVDMAAEGKLPTRPEKQKFEMKPENESTEYLMPAKMEETEEVEVEDEFSSIEGSLGEMDTEEEEEEESASVQEAWRRRQQLVEEFDAVHDEAQRLRIMNLLLHSRVLRLTQRRPKKKPGFTSTVSTASHPMPSLAASQAPSVADLTGLAESLEKELLEAGEEAAQLLKRVWPQLLRVRKERLRYTRAMHDLEAAQEEVAKLEVFGPNRTVAAYEQLAAESVKLAERVQERADQLATLRNIADRDLQQAAHLREALQGAHQDVMEAHRCEERTTLFLQKAREDVLHLKKKRDSLYKENSKLTKQMELLAYPDLLHDHQGVVCRLPLAQAELSQLRAAYVSQEQSITAARSLLLQREQGLRGRRPDTTEPEPDTTCLLLNMATQCRPSLIQVKQGPAP